MKGLWESVLGLFSSKTEVPILLVGLEGAGKTTILYKLKLGRLITPTPTVGFNKETLSHKSIDLTIWEVGGKSKKFLDKFLKDFRAVIFVVDASKSDKLLLDESAAFLHEQLLSHVNLKGVPLLVLANKQDIANSLSKSQMAQRLRLNEIKERKWFVQECSGLSGKGLIAALDWLAENVK